MSCSVISKELRTRFLGVYWGQTMFVLCVFKVEEVKSVVRTKKKKL